MKISPKKKKDFRVTIMIYKSGTLYNFTNHVISIHTETCDTEKTHEKSPFSSHCKRSLSQTLIIIPNTQCKVDTIYFYPLCNWHREPLLCLRYQFTINSLILRFMVSLLDQYLNRNLFLRVNINGYGDLISIRVKQ